MLRIKTIIPDTNAACSFLYPVSYTSDAMMMFKAGVSYP